MGCPIGQNTLFGGGNNYIKFQGGDLIAIEGANTVERQMLSDLRFNYKQLLRGRIMLKPGQVNYLMNHLGLGDNATFVSIVARYDAKSKIEEDNYINWSFYDDLTKIYPMGQYMCLTGNSTNRVKQLYLTNPNANYAVTIDVMVAVLDDSYNFFTDITNQSGTSFVNLRYTDIKSYVVGESIMFLDSNSRPLVYIMLNNINSIEITGNILIIDDNALGRLFFQFVTENDARQTNSILNYVLDNSNVDIDTILPLEDIIPPVVYWYSNVNNSATASIITLGGQIDGIPYNTLDGPTFSTTISLLEFGTNMTLSKSNLLDLLISDVVDNRDGTMSLSTGDIILTGTQGVVTQISSSGNYKMTFNLTDIAGNTLDGVEMNLNIIDYDTRPPVVYWYSRVDDDLGQPYITFNGATGGSPYTSESGNTFSTTLVFPDFQIGGEITKQQLIDLMIDKVVDYNDGMIDLIDSNIILTGPGGGTEISIVGTGSYAMTFNITDLAENSLYGVYLYMDVVSTQPDTTPPVIYWFTTVGEQPSTDLIILDGTDGSGAPYNTTQGSLFTTNISFATASLITKTDLNNILIDYVEDNDGGISFSDEVIHLADGIGPIEAIGGIGNYSMTFSYVDSSNNGLGGVVVNITVIE
jgi:hypothetical protein